MSRNNTPAILSCDPSFTGWGWVITDIDGNVFDCGMIKTQPKAKKLRIRQGDDRIRRIDEILMELNKAIRDYNICLIVSELPHGSQNAKAAIMIGVVTGILQTMAYFTDIPIEWYSQEDAKKLILGKRTADKYEMVEAMEKRYTGWKVEKPKARNEAVADALAVLCVATEQSPIIKYMERNT